MSQYYVSPTGSDSNNGQATTTPFLTVTKINTLLASGGIGPGDIVLFDTPGTYYGPIIPLTSYSATGEFVTFGSYGIKSTQPKPIISAYRVLNTSGGWTNESGNLWKIDLSNPSNFSGYTAQNQTYKVSAVGHLLVNGVHYGMLRADKSLLSAQWEFWSDDANNEILYVYSTANPTSLATDIRAACAGSVVYPFTSTMFVGLDLQGAAEGASQFTATSSRMRVLGCDIHNIGGTRDTAGMSFSGTLSTSSSPTIITVVPSSIVTRVATLLANSDVLTITGTGIAGSTTITAASGTSLTMSNSATASGTNFLTIAALQKTFTDPNGQTWVTRQGNAVTPFTGQSDYLVENCNIYDIYDSPWAPQIPAAGTIADCVIRGSRIWNCRYGFEYFSAGTPSGSGVDGLQRNIVEQNVLRSSGRGWSSAFRSDYDHPPSAVTTFTWTMPAAGNYVRNNVFFDVGGVSSFSGTQMDACYMYQTDSTPPTGLILTGNKVFLQSGTRMTYNGLPGAAGADNTAASAAYRIDPSGSIGPTQWATLQNQDVGSMFQVIPSGNPASFDSVLQQLTALTGHATGSSYTAERNALEGATKAELDRQVGRHMSSMWVQPLSTGTSAVGHVRQPGDTFDRIAFWSDGELRFGSGSATPDVRLYWNTTGQFGMQGWLAATLANVGIHYSAFVTGDSASRWYLQSNGAAGSSKASLINFGGGTSTPDSNLYWNAANQLKSDDQMILADGVATKFLSGAGKTTVTDADFTATPADGTLAVHRDTTSGFSYLSERTNGVWSVMSSTAPTQATPYMEIMRGLKILAGGQVAFTAGMMEQGAATESGTQSGLAAFYFDPAWISQTGKTSKLRLVAQCSNNTTAPAASFAFSLKPVTATSGSTGADTVTVGSAVTGSTATFTTPAAGLISPQDTGDFTAPSAGYYLLEMAQTGTMAAAAETTLRVSLLGHAA